MNMHNCLILGSGRSGTSAAAGCLANGQYFMGNDLIPARVSNPDGVFEDLHVRSINEEVLAPLLPPRRPNVESDRHIPEQWQRWLAHFPVGIEIPSSPQIKASINELISNKPYCFKDPRFSYALPVWRSQLENCVFVCMFRNPASTASSIVRFTKEFELMHSLEISFNEALDAWTMLNRHILEKHRHQGDWLFLHLDQLIYGDGLDKLAEFTGAEINRAFPKAERRRTFSDVGVSEEVTRVYDKLCDLAGFDR